MITQEFHLSITPVGTDRYLIRTEDVASGVPLAETQVDWPVDTWLAQTTAWHADPLTSLLTTGHSQEAATSQAAERLALGQTLYDALFQGRLRDSWLAAQGVAQNRHKILRLRLGFKDSRLQRLPWELLYGDDRFLATGSDVTFTRYYVGPALGEPADQLPLSTDQPLQALVVISAPNDQEQLSLRQEVQQIQQELLTGVAPPQDAAELTIKITILEQPGRAELVNALEQGQFHMLHYAGHSEVSETGGDLYLVSSRTGLTERLTGEDLAGLLVNNHIRLAVFNSCRGAYTASDDAETGWREQNLVQALVNRGVPGVIAMAERIPDDVAITFTQLLYRNLKRGYPIDLSLSRTRQGIVSAFGSDQVYWTLPILYMHPAFDGYLYEGRHQPETLDSWLLDDELELQEVVSQAGGDETDLDDTADLQALLETEQEPTYDEDAAIVTGLLQQITHPPSEPTTSVPPDQTSPPSPEAESPDVPQPISSATTSMSWPPRRWLLTGLAVLGTALVVGLLWAGFYFGGRRSLEPLAPLNGDDDLAVNLDRPAAASAIAALNQGDTETVLTLGENLLEQGNLEVVEGILLQASPTQQQENADIAYLTGRWHWQSINQGSSSIHDAHRAWQWAVDSRPDFIPALVALGFAQYAKGEDRAAIEIWETAIREDAQNLTDLNPDALQTNHPMAADAYAGIAMAYHRLSRDSVDATDAQKLQQQVNTYFDQAIDLKPELLFDYQLGWLWDPVKTDWQETVQAVN